MAHVPGAFRRQAGGLIVLALFSVVVVVPFQAFAQGSWATKTSLPSPRAGAHAAALNGVIYVAGGVNSSNTPLATMVAYDPATNNWSNKASMPTPRSTPGVAVVNGIIYVLGGSDASGPLATVEAYNPATDTWSAKASMREARYTPALAAVNGILYAISGSESFTVEAYDPATNTWTSKAAASTKHFAAAVGVINGIIYVAGSDLGGGGYSNTVEAYNPSTNTWTTKAPMLRARCSAAFGVIDGILYVAGGLGAGYERLSSVEAYDAAANKWSTAASMPTPRGDIAAGVVNGVLYAAGGWDAGFSYASKVLGTHEAFTPPAVARTPALSDGGIANGASFQVSQGIAPHSYITVTGTNLAPDTPAGTLRLWRAEEIVNGKLPVSLDGVSVTIGGKAAAIQFISATQINAIVPADAPIGNSVPVVVTTSKGASNSVAVNVPAFSPSFFVWPGNQPAATHLDGTFAVKNGTFTGVTASPARPGEIITLWGNGFGATTPAVATGMVTPATAVHNIVTPPAITIGGVQAEYLGGAMSSGFAALYQIAIRVPTVANGDQPLRIVQGGLEGHSGLVLSVLDASGVNTLAVMKAGSGSGSVTSTPAGIACGSICSATFAAGSSVTLTASADAGSTFTGWSGACTGTAACVVTLDSSKAVTATFALTSGITLTVTKAGGGGGSVTSSPAGLSCGSTCSANFPSGTSVVLTAAADAGSAFSGWSGACTGTGSCTLKMDSNKAVTATFALTGPATLTISKAGNGTGLVSSSPAGINCGSSCAASFQVGTTVVLTAVSDLGSGFALWSGACVGPAATCSVTMDGNKSVTATFLTGPTRILQVFKDKANPPASMFQPSQGAGTVKSDVVGINCGFICGTRFPAGDTLVLTAAADKGSTFTGWGSSQCTACSGTSPQCTLTMDADKCATANFVQPLLGEGGPTLAGGDGILMYVYGPAGAGKVTSDPPGINCTANADSRPCGATFALGLPVLLTATPAPGYYFERWGFNSYLANPGPGQPPAPDCPGTGPCMVPAFFTFGRAVFAYFKSGLIQPPPPPNYCNVNCSGSCFSPAVSFQSTSCAACSAVYNWCQWVLSFGCTNYKTVLYWNACSH